MFTASQSLVGLGSNLGDRHRSLDLAIQQLSATPGVRVVRASAWRSYAAIGGPADQPEFLNGAALLETTLSPDGLLARLQEIEIALDRTRQGRWGPRTVDLDLLLHDNLARRAPPLELPHPRMAFRRFVLEGAAEIAPTMRHPIIGWTVAELLEHLRSATPYVAISGSRVDSTRHLAAAAVETTGWRLVESPDANDKSQPDVPPSLTRSQAIEFLHQQAELLARDRWPIAGGAISSFWIEDLLAVGDVLWPGELDAVWQGLAATVVPPKLLAVYGAVEEPFQAARHARASRQGIGPVLWLPAGDAATAEAELIAAIEAMS